MGPSTREALDVAERLGFIKVATLHEHIKDTKRKPQNLVILEMPQGKWYEWWQF